MEFNTKESEIFMDVAMLDADSTPTAEDILQRILNDVKDLQKEFSERSVAEEREKNTRDDGARLITSQAPAIQIINGKFEAKYTHPLPPISPQTPGNFPDNDLWVQIGSEAYSELPQHFSDVERAKLGSLHEAERKKLSDEIETKKQLWEDAREKNIELSKQLAEQNAKVVKLQKMMVRAGRNDTPSIDSDISSQFVLLKSEIFQIVKSHLIYPEKLQRSPGQSPDLRDLYMRKLVASALHEKFFSRQAMPFGFEDELLENNPLRNFEEVLRYNRCEESTIKEWRIATVKACSLLGPNLAAYAMEVSKQIWQETLHRFCLHKSSPKRDACRKDLENLCQKAAKLAILFRGSSIEYEWEQDLSRLDSLEVIPKDYEIIGTKGPSPEEKDYEIGFIVFGGVVRGDKSTGLLENGRVRLSRTQIVIEDRKR